MGFDCPAVPCHASTEDRVKWILTRLREDPPDVFVPNHVLAAYFAGRWARACGMPTVGVIHSPDDYHRAIQEEFILGRTEFSLSAVVCVSGESERQLLAEQPRHTKIYRIPCGVSVPTTRVKRTSSALRLAYVGRLTEEAKRVSEVARAFCRVTRNVPGTEALLYGDGPEKTKVEHILATEGAGLPVRLAGRVDPDRIQEHLLDRDVIVLLSDYEGLPISLMEGMACGCVPICLRIGGGVSELVEDGVTGLLVDDRADSFVAAIRRLKEEVGLWGRFSQAARAKIANGYALDACASQWAELLQCLHKSGGPKRAIEIPRQIKLPLPHPGLAGQDPRCSCPPLPVRLFRRTRMAAGRWRRRLLGQPVP